MAAILLVDDHPVVLDGMAALLGGEPGWRVVGTAADRPTAIRLAAELRPDVVVLDLRMQRSYSPETVPRLKAASGGAAVLIHTATDEPAPVRAALDAGADGVVFKDGSLLVPAVRALLAGEPLPPEPRRDGPRGGVEQLSPREYQVLCAIAVGTSTRDIAAEMFLAESTIRSYTKSLLTKLDAHSRIQAVATARARAIL